MEDAPIARSNAPLAEAVAEFNRLNRFQIVIGDAELGRRLIGGTFRPDNVGTPAPRRAEPRLRLKLLNFRSL